MFPPRQPLIRIANINETGEEEYLSAFSCMPERRRRRCEAYRFENDRKRCILAYKTVTDVLMNEFGLAADELVFDLTDAGKPFLVSGKVCFSVSHSEDLVAAAFSDRPIGTDIEKIRPAELKVARRFCSGKDLAYITRGEDFPNGLTGEALTRFFEVWTFKEAYAKCTGKGLSEDVLSVSLGDAECTSRVFDGYVLTTVAAEK